MYSMLFSSHKRRCAFQISKKKKMFFCFFFLHIFGIIIIIKSVGSSVIESHLNGSGHTVRVYLLTFTFVLFAAALTLRTHTHTLT